MKSDFYRIGRAGIQIIFHQVMFFDSPRNTRTALSDDNDDEDDGNNDEKTFMTIMMTTTV